MLSNKSWRTIVFIVSQTSPQIPNHLELPRSYPVSVFGCCIANGVPFPCRFLASNRKEEVDVPASPCNRMVYYESACGDGAFSSRCRAMEMKDLKGCIVHTVCGEEENPAQPRFI